MKWSKFSICILFFASHASCVIIREYNKVQMDRFEFQKDLTDQYFNQQENAANTNVSIHGYHYKL